MTKIVRLILLFVTTISLSHANAGTSSAVEQIFKINYERLQKITEWWTSKIPSRSKGKYGVHVVVKLDDIDLVTTYRGNFLFSLFGRMKDPTNTKMYIDIGEMVSKKANSDGAAHGGLAYVDIRSLPHPNLLEMERQLEEIIKKFKIGIEKETDKAVYHTGVRGGNKNITQYAIVNRYSINGVEHLSPAEINRFTKEFHELMETTDGLANQL